MSKKIFVFEDEDWEKLKHRESDSAGLSSWELMYELKEHEVDVIEFEAEIKHYLLAPFSGVNCIPLPESMDGKFNLKEKLHVFLVKPKKPEGKGEKDRT